MGAWLQTIFPELGYYGLPGHVSDPTSLIEEIKVGDALGLGSIWLSERHNTKNVAVLAGLSAALTPRMGIATGLLSNLSLRSPLVTGSFGATMSTLTANRFALGVGRGIERLADSTGTARSNFKLLEDYIGILRRLWGGETVNYSGPAGTLTNLALGIELQHPPPVIMAVMGDKTSYWAGKFCDGVVFNSLWSAKAVEHSARLVRQGAIDAGRNPDDIKIWTILVTACETSEDYMLDVIVHRLNTYVLFEKIFDGICDANGWDKSVAAKVREILKASDPGRSSGPMGDEHTSHDRSHLRRCMDAYPAQWLDEGMAIGSADACARKVLERFDAGADGVLLHGSTATHLAPLLPAWQKIRPPVKFEGRSCNPGL